MCIWISKKRCKIIRRLRYSDLQWIHQQWLSSILFKISSRRRSTCSLRILPMTEIVNHSGIWIITSMAAATTTAATSNQSEISARSSLYLGEDVRSVHIERKPGEKHWSVRKGPYFDTWTRYSVDHKIQWDNHSKGIRNVMQRIMHKKASECHARDTKKNKENICKL